MGTGYKNIPPKEYICRKCGKLNCFTSREEASRFRIRCIYCGSLDLDLKGSPEALKTFIRELRRGTEFEMPEQ